MKNLILIRHGKSSWEAPLSDIDRPLSARGIKDALYISSEILSILPKKYLVWSSIAKRTQETSYIFAQNMQFPIENIILRNDLYTFDVSQLTKIIKTCDTNIDNLIVFGHNDAITNFVNQFGNNKIEHVPTSGLIHIQFETTCWQKIKKGKIVNLFFPKKIERYK